MPKGKKQKLDEQRKKVLEERMMEYSNDELDDDDELDDNEEYENVINETYKVYNNLINTAEIYGLPLLENLNFDIFIEYFENKVIYN